MNQFSESTLRRKLDKLGYRLRKKDGAYMISDHNTNGLIHPPGANSPYVLSLDEVRSWLDDLSEG